jgi:hypothetical protein
LKEYSRRSRATSHGSEASISVYSQHTQPVYDETGRYAAEERTGTGRSMASTRVTSASSDSSPFRFDLQYGPERNQPSSSAPQKLTPPHLDPFSPTSSYLSNPVNNRLAARDAIEGSGLATEGPPLRHLPTSDYPLEAQAQAQAPMPSSLTLPRARIYLSDEQIPRGLGVLAGSAERYRVLSVGRMDDSLTGAFARMDMSPVDLGDTPPSRLAPPRQPPRGILKAPRYLTTSTRLADRGNRI